MQQVKHLTLSLLWLGFNPWPRNFHIPWVGQRKTIKKKKKKTKKWSSHCGTTRSAASWEPWNTGSIPISAQRVEDPAWPQLQIKSQLWLGSDP